MIHKIQIQNFFSIADQQEIILKVSDKAPDLPCFQSSWAIPNERLPMVIGFFGPNASGKTTIFRALNAVVQFVRDSFLFEVDAPIYGFHTYMHKDWWDQPSKFLIDFDGSLEKDQPACLFRYELHIEPQARWFAKIVTYESLSYAPKGKFRRIFERKGQNFKFGQEFEIKDTDPRVQAIRPNASVFSTLAQFNHVLSLNFVRNLQTVQTNIAGRDKAPPNAQRMLSYYTETPDRLKALNRELRRLDVGLEEMLLERDNNGELSAHFKHIGLDLPIILEEESSGTKRFIELFPRLHYVLEMGGIAIIDEIDTDWHPLLLPELLHWFNDKQRNPKKAQLFFTAHNPSLLNELEKEQVFFTQKPSGKPTQIYRASDIHGLRRTPSLMNKYLSGELGAVPHIG